MAGSSLFGSLSPGTTGGLDLYEVAGCQVGLLEDAGADRFGGLPGRLQPGLVCCDVEIGLVQRQRFDQVGELGEDGVNLRGYSPVDLETRWHEQQLGTFAKRGNRG